MGGTGLVNVDVGSVITGIGNVADNLFTSDEERLQMALEDKKIDAGIATGQMAINQAEATHRSLFVAGWRPAIGWICAFAMGYQFILYPFLIWIWAILQVKGWVPDDLAPPPVLDTTALYTVLLGMLGIGGMRTWEKFKGVNSNSMVPTAPPPVKKKKAWQFWK